MREVTYFKLFWRYVLPAVIVGWLGVEGSSFGLFLMNQPDDMMVGSGVLLLLATAFFVVATIGWIFRKGSK
jgi:hypothetical protein